MTGERIETVKRWTQADTGARLLKASRKRAMQIPARTAFQD